MASIRQLLKEYIAQHDNPTTIENVKQLYEFIISQADEPDIEKAVNFYQRNAFSNALISFGYYNSGGGSVSNEFCEDQGKLMFITREVEKRICRYGRRFKKFGSKTNEIRGQLVFDIGENDELIIREAR